MQDLSMKLQEIAKLPSDRPMSMPGAFYTSQNRFEHEVSTVLKSGWHCLGRQDEIPNSGNFFTANLLNEPLLVVRQSDGDLSLIHI